MATDERAFFIGGQVHALTSAVLALIGSHPDTAAFRHLFEVGSQTALAKLEMSRTSDKAIEGFQSVAEQIRRLLGEET